MTLALLGMIGSISGTGFTMIADAFWARSGSRICTRDWFLVYATLGLVALHVVGIIATSIEHRENLVNGVFDVMPRI